MAAQHQHYVPQLLLKGFLSRDPERAARDQVHVFDLEDERAFTPPIDKIMGERRFNDFQLGEETRATIEPAAGRIETHVAPLVERMRREKSLERTPEVFRDLALLMAFQLIRTKKMRLLPERLNEQLRDKVKRMGLDPAKVKGLIDWNEEMLKLEHVHNQLEGLEKNTKLIAEKEFFLMSAPEGRSFYLGDHPVVMHNDEERRGMFGGLGLAVPYIQIYLPISADLTLCAYDRALLGQMMRGRDEEIREIQLEALALLQRRKITPSQMREAMEGLKDHDSVALLIDSIRAGRPVAVGADQVEFYNSLQAFHAHRFVIDPDGKFEVAAMVARDRKKHPQEGI